MSQRKTNRKVSLEGCFVLFSSDAGVTTADFVLDVAAKSAPSSLNAANLQLSGEAIWSVKMEINSIALELRQR
jgi:hypothetical protein